MMNKLAIEKELTSFIGKELICPDGETRKLVTFECGRNDRTTLHFGAGKFKEIENSDFEKEWTRYSLVRLPEAPVAPVDLAQAVATPSVKIAEMQAAQLIDVSDVTMLLKEQMLRVKQDGKNMAQAKVMADLAKQIIEANKLKLETMKLVRDINSSKDNK